MSSIRKSDRGADAYEISLYCTEKLLNLQEAIAYASSDVSSEFDWQDIERMKGQAMAYIDLLDITRRYERDRAVVILKTISAATDHESKALLDNAIGILEEAFEE
jgi:hypothetical protein